MRNFILICAAACFFYAGTYPDDAARIWHQIERSFPSAIHQG